MNVVQLSPSPFSSSSNSSKPTSEIIALTSKMFRPAANSLLRSAARMASQKRWMSDAPQMAFTFAAPNAVHYTDADVRQIDVPSFSGSFGILPNHVPALAVLK